MAGFLDSYEWEDWDLAEYALGESLGILPKGGFPVTHNWVVTTDTPMGRLLGKMLRELIDIGYLETDVDDDLRIRRCSNWKLSQ
jgi:hypothetical protein